MREIRRQQSISLPSGQVSPAHFAVCLSSLTSPGLLYDGLGNAVADVCTVVGSRLAVMAAGDGCR